MPANLVDEKEVKAYSKLREFCNVNRLVNAMERIVDNPEFNEDEREDMRVMIVFLKDMDSQS